ncbi:hypothetical protein DFH07DRAFT_317812 [Mycena maculata]|uniref:Transmembrane protein n=1 Tax=Mycena maculata TaxID=230809 RepID=A0AAD7P049_9AGAR|nr:hypothetical protein DFH07DRAFT_317812 [Mycena maculata]
MIPISIPVAKQPAMDLYSDHAHAHVHADEKVHAHTHAHEDDARWSTPHDHRSAPSHNPCHNSRLRRLLLPALIALTLLAGLVALFCVLDDPFGMNGIVEGLLHVKRAVTGDDSGSGSTESAFTKHKLYLIVVFVGLLVVLVLAVMLSAWCCRGAFENPCCCPCYLCACCGGLACLECIGCGLCAEGVEQM